jgi:8-oxo-dGTP pyrophosphatase MutT (NUDIX family)
VTPLALRLEAALAASAHLPEEVLDREPDWPEPVPAAVLIAITDRVEPGVLLTMRHAGLRTHGGQVAFPGGRLDADDASSVAAALREAEEEIGLPPAAAVVVGRLPSFLTISDYLVVPVVAVVPPDLPLAPRAGEVERLFEVPLAHLLAPANRQETPMLFRGQPRVLYEICGAEERIWGATAAMIADLGRRLGAGW